MLYNMTDHMWTPIEEEDIPGGCVRLETLFGDGSIRDYCSCDLHWEASLDKPLPTHFRYSLDKEP